MQETSTKTGSSSCCSGQGGHGMMKMHARSWALLALRVAAGVIFIYHGYGKLFGAAPGMEGFTAMVARLGFPLPVFWAYLVAILEFFGGIGLILGLFVKKISFLLIFDMLVAWGMAKKFALPMGDPDLALLGISIALTLMGAGKFSVMAMMKKNEKGCCGEGHHADMGSPAK